jgi:glycine/D-amino acid oxidase-like deaminating enzyme
VLLEATRCGAGASGRNGGFLQSSLTHGTRNGWARFPDEIERLERLGRENFEALAHDLEQLRVDAELESPLFLGGLWTRTSSALVHPGKLADGLRAAAARAGVRIHERSPVRALRDTVSVITDAGVVKARAALLATSAYPPPVRAVGRYVAPVYDYALVTEPLDQSLIAWHRRQGFSDMGKQFHYYRLTADRRILWGGYDAVYRYGGPVGPQFDDHEPTFARLAQHFFTVFPQLEGVRFTHRWGGAIDTCSRFSVFFGRALGGRVSYALGYTGLGVGASRFGGRVALDLLDGRATEATGLSLVHRRPLPFPPEPLRSAVIQLTRNRMAAADRNEERRGLWLRTLDRMGLGFDS